MRTKRPTIRDVADRAGVSISVVSYVLNDTPGQSFPEDTRRRIFNAAAELDYTPNAIARGMRLKKSMMIGLVSFWDITDPVIIGILNGLDRVCQAKDYNVVIYSFSSNAGKDFYVEAFKQSRIDGLVFVAPFEVKDDFDEREHLQMIKNNAIPAVILNGSTHDAAMKYVYIDFFATSYMATEYLIGLGHRDICYLLPDDFEMKRIIVKERINGFLGALRDNDIAGGSERLSTPSDMDRLIRRIKDGTGPTAIVANKTDYAQKLLERFINAGVKVPEDVSIVACNTLPYAEYLYPPLTTVQIPTEGIGAKAGELLLSAIEGDTEGISLMLPNTLVERKSCRAVEK